jgi:hypothetical protein
VIIPFRRWAMLANEKAGKQKMTIRQPKTKAQTP